MLAGVDVNTRDASGDAPINLAIKGGRARLAESLLLSGADQHMKRTKRLLPRSSRCAPWSR